MKYCFIISDCLCC